MSNPENSGVFALPQELLEPEEGLLPALQPRSWMSALAGWTLRLGLEGARLPRKRSTEDRAVEDHLRGLHEELAAAFEMEEVGQVHIDARHFRILKANRAFCRMTGHFREDLLSRSFLELAADEHRPDGKRGFVEMACGTRSKWSAELGMVRRDGTRLWVRVSGALLGETNSLPCRIALTLQDRTTARNDEGRLREAEERLRQGERLETLGRNAASAVHDLNNLIAAIGGFSELIALRTAGDARTRDYAEEIFLCSGRAAALARDILNPAAGDREKPEPLDLNHMLGSVARTLEGQLGPNIRLSVMTTESAPKVRAVPGDLERILLNLAANARDAMPLGGDLALRAFSSRQDGSERAHGGVPIPSGRYAGLEVEDTGHGMDPEALGNLFQAFYSTRGRKGNGLGLAGVPARLAPLGGFVQVSSRSGHGTVFRLLFPHARLEPVDAERTGRGV